MARDEALLALAGREADPTLRLYEWSEPTISLGYFQRYADYEVLPPPAGRMPVVRRLTGGGAILHDRELTYSLTLPADHALVAGRPKRLYELVHQSLIACFSEAGIDAQWCGRTDESGPAKGPFFCFARRHRFDVLIGSDKVAGSAQRRTRDAILQQGSIVLEGPEHAYPRLRRVKACHPPHPADLGMPRAGSEHAYPRLRRVKACHPPHPADLGMPRAGSEHAYPRLRRVKACHPRRMNPAAQEPAAVLEPTAAALGGEGFDAIALRRRLPAALAELMGTECRNGAWGDDEMQLAGSLIDKYGGPAWTRRR